MTSSPVFDSSEIDLSVLVMQVLFAVEVELLLLRQWIFTFGLAPNPKEAR